MNRLSCSMGSYRESEKKVSPNGKIIKGRFGTSCPERLISIEIEPSANVSGPSSKAIEDAIMKYRKGRISLGRAAELSNISYNEMIEELRKQDIKIRFGAENKDEAKKEVEIIQKIRNAD